MADLLGIRLEYVVLQGALEVLCTFIEDGKPAILAFPAIAFFAKEIAVPVVMEHVDEGKAESFSHDAKLVKGTQRDVVVLVNIAGIIGVNRVAVDVI